MSIILRKDKISPLTFEELDGNFEFLTKFITDIQTGIETGESIPIDYIRSLFSGNLGIVYNVSTGSIAIDKSSAVTTVKVTGPVKKGQRIVTSDLPGVGKAINNDNIVSLLSVVGRALENSNDDNIKLVECVVGKL